MMWLFPYWLTNYLVIIRWFSSAGSQPKSVVSCSWWIKWLSAQWHSCLAAGVVCQCVWCACLWERQTGIRPGVVCSAFFANRAVPAFPSQRHVEECVLRPFALNYAWAPHEYLNEAWKKSSSLKRVWGEIERWWWSEMNGGEERAGPRF